MKSTKTSELRKKTKPELLKILEDLIKEQFSHNCSREQSSAVHKKRMYKKDIARVLTVYNQNQKAALRKSYANQKYVPYDLRPKQTRAFRRRLTPEQKNKKTLRQQKKDKAFPMRMYALKAFA